jgi:hypothetical protein
LQLEQIKSNLLTTELSGSKILLKQSRNEAVMYKIGFWAALALAIAGVVFL